VAGVLKGAKAVLEMLGDECCLGSAQDGGSWEGEENGWFVLLEGDGLREEVAGGYLGVKMLFEESVADLKDHGSICRHCCLILWIRGGGIAVPILPRMRGQDGRVGVRGRDEEFAVVA